MSAPATLAALQRHVREALALAEMDDPAGEARLLVGGLLGLSPTALITDGGRLLAAKEIVLVAAALERRLKHEPVHRILGRREFYGLDLVLSPGTLEPRPDTEILVDRMLPHLQRISQVKGQVTVLDLGTGTGAILLALLSECESAHGTAVDISTDALATASANAEQHGLSARFTAVGSDWFSQIRERFDIIVSNPPYIGSAVVAGLLPEVRDHDPVAALDGGEDGLDAYRLIAAGAGAHLLPGGVLGLEIGYDQKGSVSALFAAEGFHLIDAARDYGGNDRVLVFDRGDR